jgi:hypothetical protein
MKKLFNYHTWTRSSTNEVTHFLTLFGFTFILGWAGNCIYPCFHISDYKTITIRFNFNNQINIYLPMKLRNGSKRSLNWNWDWLARKLGTSQEAPHGTIWCYSGILGNHSDV